MSSKTANLHCSAPLGEYQAFEQSYTEAMQATPVQPLPSPLIDLVAVTAGFDGALVEWGYSAEPISVHLDRLPDTGYVSTSSDHIALISSGEASQTCAYHNAAGCFCSCLLF